MGFLLGKYGFFVFRNIYRGREYVKVFLDLVFVKLMMFLLFII